MSNNIADRIVAINKQVDNINIQREKNLSTKDVYLSQLENLCDTYKSNYGVELTAETIEEERTKVLQETEVEVQLLEQVVEAINTNNIRKAKELLGITEPTVEKATDNTSVAQPSVGTMQQVQNISENVGAPQKHENAGIPQMATQVQENVSVGIPAMNVQGTMQETVVPPLVQEGETFVEEVLDDGEGVPKAPTMPTSVPQAPTQSQASGFTQPSISNIRPAVIPKATEEVVEKPKVSTPPSGVPVIDDDEDEEGNTVDGSIASKAMSFNSILGGTAFNLNNL